MYKHLARSHIHADLASPMYLGLEIIKIIILPCVDTFRAPVYAWNSHPCLFEIRNNLNNYFAMYKRHTRTRICVERASPAYLGLGII